MADILLRAVIFLISAPIFHFFYRIIFFLKNTTTHRTIWAQLKGHLGSKVTCHIRVRVRVRVRIIVESKCSLIKDTRYLNNIRRIDVLWPRYG